MTSSAILEAGRRGRDRARGPLRLAGRVAGLRLRRVRAAARGGRGRARDGAAPVTAAIGVEEVRGDRAGGGAEQECGDTAHSGAPTPAPREETAARQNAYAPARQIFRAPRAVGRRPPPALRALLAAAQLLEHLVAPLVRAQRPVAHGGDAQIGVGLGLVALDQPAGAQHLHDRQVLRGEPDVGDLAPVHVGAAVLHRAEAPRLDRLGQRAERPRVRDRDPRALVAAERHALAEQPLVVLERQVADAQVARRAARASGSRRRRRRCRRARATSRPTRGGARRARRTGRRRGRARSAAATRRGAARRRSAPSGCAAAARWAGSRGRSPRRGRRSRRSRRAGPPAARGPRGRRRPARRRPPRTGGSAPTSSGSRRSRRPMSASRRARRAREKSPCASAAENPEATRPLCGPGQSSVKDRSRGRRVVRQRGLDRGREREHAVEAGDLERLARSPRCRRRPAASRRAASGAGARRSARRGWRSR